MANPMFVLDERMVESIFDYCRQRLALDPVSLDFGGSRQSFDDVLSGLIGESGNDPGTVLSLFADHLATAVISCDSPRFLSFIPAAPTKAALLFDMIVSCSSLQGTSWLEAAGAVAAENQVLEFLADLAGLPPGAGGCFVSGGSIANLSALVVARDTTMLRRHAVPLRARMAVSEETHASVQQALRILGVEPFVVPSVDHRLTGAALRAALDGFDHADDVVGVVATAGTTNAGIVDDLKGISSVAARALPVVPRRRGLRRGGAVHSAGPGPLRGHRARRLLRHRPPQVALRAFRLRRPRVSRAGIGQSGALSAGFVPRCHP